MEEDLQASSITNLSFDAIEGTIQRHDKTAQEDKIRLDKIGPLV